MLNLIWLAMIFLSVIVGCIEGRLDKVVQAVTDSAKASFEIALNLAGIMALWLGIMEIAFESGLLKRFTKLLKPVMQPLFPDVPNEHPAMQAMLMNMSANMLGLANAATPFGLEAMKQLAILNNKAHEASDAMCTFLAINTSSIQLIPSTAIAFLAAAGASNPSVVIVSALFATCCSTLVAILAVKYLAKWPRYQMKGELAE